MFLHGAEGKSVPCSKAVLVHVYSRSLRPGGVLLKLTVVDGEVRPEVAAVTQRRNTAARKENISF